MPEIKYGTTVGSKFNPDGSVRQFPGNTVICFIDPQSAVYAHCHYIQEQLRSFLFAHKFALIPIQSVHFTAIQLLVDQRREPKWWSSSLPLDATLKEADAFFIKTFETVPTCDGFDMAFRLLRSGPNSISVGIWPSTDDELKRLRQYRDAVAEATGVRLPHHETFPFHITLAYHIIQQAPEEAEQFAALLDRVNNEIRPKFANFKTGRPQLAFFDDMFDFVATEKRYLLRSRQNI